MGAFPRIALLPLALAAPLVAGEPPAGPTPAVPRDRLPVLGTVGDLPPEKERVIVEVTATGAIQVGGASVDMEGLRKVLIPRAAAYREADAQKSAKLAVVLRVDRDARWRDAQGVIGVLQDPKLRIYKVLFAAVPRDGGAEGAMALFQPNRPAPEEAAGAPSRRVLPIRLLAEEDPDAPTGASLLAELERSWRWMRSAILGAELEAAPRVSTGAVLEAADAFLLWRRGPVTFRVVSRASADAGAVIARPKLLIREATVPGKPAKDPAPPVPARVVGRMAGQVAPPAAWPADEAAGDGGEGGAVAVGGGAGGLFGGRRSRARERAPGGGPQTEAAVEGGLDWLARHQSPDGSWDSDGFQSRCGAAKCGGPGGPLYDPGVTGLALLAFLGHGESDESGRYGAVVRKGLDYLAGIQDPEGCFGRRTSNFFMYNHALASLALIEAYGMTRSARHRESAQNAVKFIVQCRNPGLGWRYTVKPGQNDTSVTGWMVTALAMARAADLDYDPDAFDGAMAWLASVTEEEWGRAGYTEAGNGPARPQELITRYPSAKTESITAIATWTRLLCGATRSDPMVGKGLALCSNVLPVFDPAGGSTDYYYWHFGTLAMFQVGGDPWSKWNEAVKAALLGSQRKGEGDERRGSWDPLDPWQAEGGRIYSTAINTLTLETYYRYQRFAPGK